MELVLALQPSMVRVARMYVSSDAVAEEVVQDAWVGVLKGLDRFEGRSSCGRGSSASSRTSQRPEDSGRGAACRSRRSPATTWRPPPGTRHRSWGRGAIARGRGPACRTTGADSPKTGSFPPRRGPWWRKRSKSCRPLQSAVIRLHDVAGWSSEEVRNALDLTETNQRVLLHRARAKVRRALDEYLERA